MAHAGRAFALIYQMLISVIVLLLVGAILLTSRNQVFTARGELLSLRAQYAAEAGLQWVIAELARNPAWQGTLTRQAVPADSSTFTVTMVRGTSASSAGRLDSINNLTNSSAARSYLGANSVPPRSALVVVVGEASGYRQELEAFVSGGGSWSQGAALLASGPIDLRRDVFIDGFESLHGSETVPGNVHSNQPEGPDAVRWQGHDAAGSYALHVSGTVSSVSADPNAIALNGSTGAVTKADAPYRKLPDIDVPGLVRRFNSPAGAVLVGPTIVLNGGNHYYSDPNLVINGDVELRDGARLVVSGNLTVNGSITGMGAVLVDGDARLCGDSRVAGDKNDFVSLIAAGHVVIAGFDGTAYLDALAARERGNSSTPRGAEAEELWTDIKFHTDWLRRWILSHPNPSSPAWTDANVDAHLAVLGQGGASWGPGTRSSTHVDVAGWPVHPRRNSLGALAARLNGTGSTETFLRERFQSLDDLFRDSGYGRNGDLGLNGSGKANHNLNDMHTYLAGTWNPVRSGGLIDLAQSAWFTYERTGGGEYSAWSGTGMNRLRTQLIPDLLRQLDDLNYDRLGAAQFRGLVYARGGILVHQEVNVVGSMIAAGDPSLTALSAPGGPLQPGEIRLDDGSRFTYVKELFEDGVLNFIDLGILDVKSWRLRN